ncbi:zinc transporter ZIP1-like isoform X1 [Homalodisca vitripennis]|uniref:zinc transporter ZIP1-like isoform X1 n=2 Tax=Homalodisca vitripennis TaxID=197043 RepID=UPI001EEB2D7E|nr:zinc transporter ZIP1-like isoform X1 [Homalodisca vitripennis]
MEVFENLSEESWTTVVKGSFVVGLFLFTLMFALLPMIVIKSYRTERDPDKRTQYSRLIGLLNCFAGGVFLGTAMLHLLPNVIDMLNEVKLETKFPIAEFTVAFGFLLVMVVEQTALACKEQEVDTLNPIQRLNQRGPVIDSEICGLRQRQTGCFFESSTGYGAVEHMTDTGCSTVSLSVHNQNCGNTARASQEPSATYLPETVEPKPTSYLRSVLLLTVLSLHSLFEGLAIGLQNNIESIFNIFAAVMIHKLIVAFSVGLSLLQSKLHMASVLSLDVLFALMSPSGLVLGLFVDTFQSSPRQQLFSGMLQGIACGTFVYITCFEVLPKELTQGRDRLLKLLTLLVGFSVTVGIIFIDGR